MLDKIIKITPDLNRRVLLERRRDVREKRVDLLNRLREIELILAIAQDRHPSRTLLENLSTYDLLRIQLLAWVEP